MSVVEYLKIWHRCSREIDWQIEREWLKLIYKRFIPDGSEDDITDVSSLLNKLEEKNLLGIDRLNVLKEVLKGTKEWDLLRILKRFEVQRKGYRQFLEQINCALEGSIELQQLISICSKQNLIAHEREEHIVNVKSLFTELQQQNNLGIENLSILKTIATEVNKPELCRLVDDFDDKREQEEDAEREREEREDYRRRTRAQAVSVLTSGINIGKGVMGVVTPLCTFRNLAGGAVAVTTLMVLRRSSSMKEFVNAFEEAVLPLGNFLLTIDEGSIRFTIQAENLSALDVLWQTYQDETLQKKLQEFLVTGEISQLAGGEVALTVYIDEEEYRNARLDLRISKTEGMKLEAKEGLKDRASPESDLLKKVNIEDLSPEREFLPFHRKARVAEYIENIPETVCDITLPSDSDAETGSVLSSEYGFDEGEGDRFEDSVTEASENWTSCHEASKNTFPSKEDRMGKLEWFEDSIKDALGNMSTFQKAFKDTYPSEGGGVSKVMRGMERIRVTLETFKQSEKMWMSADPILTSSSSPEDIIQELENSPQLYHGFSSKISEHKTAIRGLARKAKHLNRRDLFKHLRKITSPGTTGPQLPDDLEVYKISTRRKSHISRSMEGYGKCDDLLKQLDLKKGDNFLRDTTLLDVIATQHQLTTVGELYDFLCDHGLPKFADKL